MCSSVDDVDLNTTDKTSFLLFVCVWPKFWILHQVSGTWWVVVVCVYLWLFFKDTHQP